MVVKNRFVMLICICLLALSMFPAAGSAAASDIKVMVNDEELNFTDGKPYVDNTGRVQVPIRIVAEALGLRVHWNAERQSVTFINEYYDSDGSLRETVVSMTMGQDWYEMYGSEIKMDTAPIIQNERVYVPLRFIAEAFGVETNWDGKTKTVHLKRKAPREPVRELSGGFTVPINSILYVEDLKGVGAKLVEFSIITGSKDHSAYIDGQIEELRHVLTQQINENIVNSIIQSYIKTDEPKREGSWYQLTEEPQYLAVGWDPEGDNHLRITLYEKGFDAFDFFLRGDQATVIPPANGEPLRIGYLNSYFELPDRLSAYGLEAIRAQGEFLSGNDQAWLDFIDKYVLESTREWNRNHLLGQNTNQLDPRKKNSIANTYLGPNITPNGLSSNPGNQVVVTFWSGVYFSDLDEYAAFDIRLVFSPYDDETMALTHVKVTYRDYE